MDMIPAGVGVGAGAGAPGQQMGSPGVGMRILVRPAEMLQLTTLLVEAATRERTLATKIKSLEVRACQIHILVPCACSCSLCCIICVLLSNASLNTL